MSLSDAGMLLEGVIENSLEMRARLATRYNLVDNPQFGCDIVKVQRPEERTLSIGEWKAIQHLRPLDCTGADEASEKPRTSFAE